MINLKASCVQLETTWPRGRSAQCPAPLVKETSRARKRRLWRERQEARSAGSAARRLPRCEGWAYLPDIVLEEIFKYLSYKVGQCIIFVGVLYNRIKREWRFLSSFYWFPTFTIGFVYVYLIFQMSVHCTTCTGMVYTITGTVLRIFSILLSRECEGNAWMTCYHWSSVLNSLYIFPLFFSKGEGQSWNTLLSFEQDKWMLGWPAIIRTG